MAVTMRQATSNMTSAVKGMNEDMETTNLVRVGPSPPPLPIPPLNSHPRRPDLARCGQVQGAVLGPRCTEMVRGGHDEVDKGHVDAAGPCGS